MRTLLIVNDDGINSSGIQAAVEAVSSLGKVVVIAPAVQQSGVGRSMSLFTPVGIAKGGLVGVDSYAINGTPVDAVIVGIYGILRKNPDLIISGINIGENMSSETMTSGTVGAALEGASQGVPSLAISVHAREEIKFEAVQQEVDFTLAQEVLRKIAGSVLERGLPVGADILNVNVPETPQKREVRITRLARRMYTTRVEERYDPRGRPYFWIDGDAIYEAEEDTDVHAVRVEGCVSITPMKLDFTSSEALAETEGLKGLLQ